MEISKIAPYSVGLLSSVGVYVLLNQNITAISKRLEDKIDSLDERLKKVEKKITAVAIHVDSVSSEQQNQLATILADIELLKLPQKERDRINNRKKLRRDFEEIDDIKEVREVKEIK